jgi:hypothetical protein
MRMDCHNDLSCSTECSVVVTTPATTYEKRLGLTQAEDYILTLFCPVISIAPSPTGKLFATASGDLRARIWK